MECNKLSLYSTALPYGFVFVRQSPILQYDYERTTTAVANVTH